MKSEISFDGIQIDADIVRAKLEEHETAKAGKAPHWPVRLCDCAHRLDGPMGLGYGAILTISQCRDMRLEFGPTTDYFGPHAGLSAYIRDVLKSAEEYDDSPPAIPFGLRDYVRFGE